ncbi:unnamed protein product [Oppiella nova]|uniref:Uncharacterized protein n=1 Tax=Oppiella nova TaxID=334625 RepID=A0A7R9QLD2_9ACAR|nr:unnamed protein product [Oppiella nova]CAG2167588.1 unnamed protein product [Oppiella nova]
MSKRKLILKCLAKLFMKQLVQRCIRVHSNQINQGHQGLHQVLVRQILLIVPGLRTKGSVVRFVVELIHPCLQSLQFIESLSQLSGV